MTSSTIHASKFKRSLMGGTAAIAIAGASVLALPGTASAATPVQAPTVTTTVEGNTVDFAMSDPNTGLSNALTTCTPVLIDVAKAIPLLPGLAAGTIPPLDTIDPAMFAWGPAIPGTLAGNRNRTWQIPDVPNGIYLAIGVCISPTALDQPAIDFSPVFVGSPINIGSAALGLGSGVLATPGGLSAVLELLGIDTGSLGSLGSSGSSDSGGSGGSGGSASSGSSGSSGSAGSNGSSATDASSDAASGSTGSLDDAMFGSRGQIGSAGNASGSNSGGIGSATQF